MIAYLKGTALKTTEKGLIIVNAGLGHFVHLNQSTLSNLPSEQEIELFIHSHIREDAFDLYGFQHFDQFEFFKVLLGISGIGPKVALEILNQPLDQLKNAIFNGDSDFFKRIPGIGGKTAQRIILELKGKIEFLAETRHHRNVHHDALEALKSLGYKDHQITKVLQDLPVTINEPEQIITYFLQNV